MKWNGNRDSKTIQSAQEEVSCHRFIPRRHDDLFICTPIKKILVGTREGAVTIERDAPDSEWRIGQRAVTDKHISAIMKEPESGLVFAGAFHGGVMVSADEGKSWEARNNGMTQNNVYSLAAKNVNGHVRLFAGTEPAHLFVSEDSGSQLARAARSACRAERAQVELPGAAPCRPRQTYQFRSRQPEYDLCVGRSRRLVAQHRRRRELGRIYRASTKTCTA